MKKIGINFKKTGFKSLICLVVICLHFGDYSSFAQNGKTGSLDWELSNSTLTITGNDTMPDYRYEGGMGTAPWYGYGNAGMISTVIIGEGVKSIGDAAFVTFYNLTSVSIPNSVTKIGKEAFYYCQSLPSIILPDSLTIIREMTFNNCRSLTSIRISSLVTSIEAGAFNGAGLEFIICEAIIPPTIEASTFSFSATFPITIPCGSMEAYKAAYVWKVYTNYQAIGFPSPEDIAVSQPNTAMEVSWQSLPAALNYVVYRNNDSLTTVSTTTYTDNNVSNGVTYCYKLKANYASCLSGYSEEVCLKYTTTGINNLKIENENTDYILYPNPSTGELTINNSTGSTIEGDLEISAIEIFDISGKMVQIHYSNSITNNTINVSSLQNGMYFITFYNAGEKITKKFVKE